jgi:hypothetical protein
MRAESDVDANPRVGLAPDEDRPIPLHDDVLAERGPEPGAGSIVRADAASVKARTATVCFLTRISKHEGGDGFVESASYHPTFLRWPACPNALDPFRVTRKAIRAGRNGSITPPRALTDGSSLIIPSCPSHQPDAKGSPPVFQVIAHRGQR